MKRLLAVLSAIVFGVVSIAAQNPVGYVLEIEGSWILNGSNSLSQGEKLPAAGSIRLQPNSSRDSRITIADMRGAIIKNLNCAADGCARAFLLPRQTQPGSLWNYIYTSTIEMIWGSPAKYSAHRSRGGELSDGVLLLKDDKIDFTAVINQAGENYLRWRVVSANKSGDWSAAVKLEKTQNGFAPVAFSGFKPALYEIELLRRGGGAVYEPLSTAWILVCAAGDYEKSLASFREAVVLTGSWDNKVKPETTRIFLQAHLDRLAQTAKPLK